MKKITVLLNIFFFSFLHLGAQDLIYKELKWEEKPKIHTLETIYNDEAAVIIKDYRTVQIDINSRGADTYFTEHKIIRVNSDAGIEKFNKVYIPVGKKDQIIQLNVRTISPKNEIKTFDKSNLKQLSNVDGYSNYNIFAVEGIVKGGEIEYKYTIRQEVRTLGREIYQSDTPIVSARFELISPKGFKFSSKSYNGFPQFKLSDTYSSEIIKAKNIPALTDEGYSSYKSKLMRVDYKIISNPANSNLINWTSISKDMFATFRDPMGKKQASKFLKELDLKQKTEEEKIIAIEKAMKESFTIKEGRQKDYNDVSFVFKNKYGGTLGIIKAYIKCFEHYKINYSLVFTCSRFLGEIDPDFAHSMDLRNIIFYFPSHDKYVAPEIDHLRYGAPPNVQGGSNGLFISTMYAAGSESVLLGGSIEELPILGPDKNNLGVNALLKLNESKDEITVQHEQFSQGYRSYIDRFYYAVGEPDMLEDYKRSTITSAIEDAEYKSFKLVNEDLSLSTDFNSYFKTHTEFTSKSLVQKAGNDILISIGKVIGKQMEMYEEKKRTTDVLLYNTKRYSHKITLEIPEGYICKGLEPLKINNEVLVDGKKVMRFVSDYTIKDNILSIKINEDYDVQELSSQYYNDYRKVINSAADFNKIVLVFEKK